MTLPRYERDRYRTFQHPKISELRERVKRMFTSELIVALSDPQLIIDDLGLKNEPLGTGVGYGNDADDVFGAALTVLADEIDQRIPGGPRP
jgi:hypothetical protein